MMQKKIMIVGAGYAGIEAALTLQKKKKKSDNIEISVIDRNSNHTLLTELHEVAGNRINGDGVIVPLKDIFKYTDVRLIKDEITNIDFDNNQIISSIHQYDYDYLIMAAGSQPNYFGIEGMQEHSFPLWSFEDAVAIREHIKDCFEKSKYEKNEALKKQLRTFIVGGGGFTGVEMIGELGQWVKLLCKEYDIPRESVRLILVEALPTILSYLKPSGIKKCTDYLVNKLNVDVRTNSQITKLTKDSITLKSGETIPTNTLIWTAGIKAAQIAEDIASKVKSDKKNRLEVDEYTKTQYKNVFSIGDVCAFKDGNSTMPSLVETALQTGKASALNILSEIRGEKLKPMKPNLHGVMVSIGSFFAVTDLKGYELPRPFAVMIKYLVNVHYLFGIGGFELVLRYLKHELLEKKQEKFLLEKHYSSRTRALWLVPIRLFLGYAWLMEGIKKIGEYWLESPILAGSGADTVSSASVFSIVQPHTPAFYAWIADNIVVPNALLFQTMIVLTEIAIGLAFISGTFTFLAAIVALGLNVNFILSTGLLESTWWYIPAALCMFGGAGRAFGLDYYIMPYLMRQWRYFVRNKKIKLFLIR